VAQALIRAGQNSPTIQSGALTFDRGVKEFMNFGPQPLRLSVGFTAVFKITWNGTALAYERVFDFVTTTSGGAYSVGFARNSPTNQFYFYLIPASGGIQTVTTAGAMVQGTSYVVTARYSPVTGIADIWINGIQNTSASGATGYADFTCTNSLIGIDASKSSFPASASMNTLAIYNRALSNVEIYNSYLALTTNTTNAPIEIGDVNGTPALSIAGDGRVSVTNLGQTSNVVPWPPAAMTGYVTSLNGGIYRASASSEFPTPATGYPYAWYAFDKSATNYWVTNAPLYSSSSPYAYTGTVTTTDVNGTIYPGEWVQIQKPVSTIVSSYVITCNGIAAAPRNFVILGSRDGVNWFLVDSESSVTWTGVGQSLTFSVQSTQAFSYYRAVTRNIQGNGTYVQFIEWTLYGTADTAQTLTVAQPVTLSYGAQTASLTGISGDKFVPQDFSSSGLNIPAYVVSNTATVANTVAFSSFGPFAGEGSVYYPGGKGAYVAFPSGTPPNFTLASATTTFECWFYPTGSPGNNNTIISHAPPASGTYDWIMYIENNSKIGFYSPSPYFALYSTNTVNFNAWNHVAWSFSGGTIYIALNGVVNTGSPGSTQYTSSFSMIVGGAGPGTTGQQFFGYLADVRILYGLALYQSSSYTPPTGPLQPIQGVTQAGLPYGTVLLLRNAPAPGRVLTSKFAGQNSSAILPFPPAAMTTYTTTLNAGYGQGTYIVAASTERTNNNAWMAYNRLFVANGGEWQPSGGYTASNPGPSAYTGTTITVDVNGASYGGEWLQVQLPSSVTASGYTVSVSSSAYASYLPGSWWVLGSRDGTNWYLVSSISNVSQSTFSYINSAYYSVNIPVSSSQAFTYWRLIVRTINGVGSTNTLPAVAGFFINGTIEGPSVSADGRLGLGVSNPVQALEVAGNSLFYGRVGVGTTSPLYKLDVIGSTALATPSIVAFRNSAGGQNASGGDYVNVEISLGSYGPFIRGVQPNAGYTDSHRLDLCTNQGSNDPTAVPRMSITSGTAGGRVGIGTTSPGATFHIDRTSAGGDAAWIFQRDGGGYTSIRYDTPTTSFYAGTGGATASVNWRDRFCIFNPSNAGVYLTYGGLAWGNTSDLRAKNILGEISNAVAKVDTLRSIFYTLKDDDTATRRVGLVAQEVVEVLPEAVDIPTADDGLYGIRYTELIPLALAAIKELSAQNTTLEQSLATATANVSSLEAQLATLAERLSALEQRLAASEL
jgi:hypothetical protein